MTSRKANSAVGTVRFMHTMLRVEDLERTIRFYTHKLGMRLLWRRDHEAARFSNALVSYGDEAHDPAIEFFQGWDEESRSVQNQAFGHLAFETHGIRDTCALVALAGCKVTAEPRVSSRGDMLMAFIEDPDGYCIELLEPISKPDPGP